MIQNSLLSVVATSYTTERLSDIYELLESIGNQTYKNIETIFVAERSKELYDRVKDYCEAIRLPDFKIVFTEDKLLLSGARSLGAKNARGEIIAFVDDDVVLFPEWADEMIKSYQDDSVIGVSGAALKKRV